jgi:hypothetical protein
VALFALASCTFTLNDFDIRAGAPGLARSRFQSLVLCSLVWMSLEGNIGAKFIMTNNRLVEYNMGLLNPPVATRYITVVDICIYDAVRCQ